MKSGKYFSATIRRKNVLTPTVVMMRLNLDQNEEIKFRSGQHIVLKIPVGNQFLDRSFSIASSPRHKDYIDIIVRLITGGIASSFLQSTQVGENITFCGPRGNFRTRAPIRNIYFITSGSGIAPIRSMLFEILDVKAVKTPITLLFLVHSRAEIFLEKELNQLSKKYKNFTYTIILPNDIRRKKFKTRNPLSYFHNLQFNKNSDFYLCGGVNFVRDINSILIQKGVHSNNIHFEEFK